MVFVLVIFLLGSGKTLGSKFKYRIKMVFILEVSIYVINKDQNIKKKISKQYIY